VTAIFLVWNRKGLAVAADSNLSLVREMADGTERVLATSETSKIFKVKDKNFVFAWSGNDAINGIPISGIVDRWVSQSERQENLIGYAENFIKWFASKSFLEDESTYPVLEGSLTRQFQLMKSRLDENDVGERTQEEVVDWYYDHWEKNCLPSIYGGSKSKHEPKEKFGGDEVYFAEFVERFSGFGLSDESHTKYLVQVEAAFASAYDVVFKDSPWYQDEHISQLKLRSVKFNMDYIFEENQTTLMLAGYGEEDWIPSCVVMKVFNFDALLPRVAVTRVTDPNSVWYEQIGEYDTVDKFFAPIDYQVLRELRERLHKKFSGRNYLDKVMVEIDDIVRTHSADLLDPVRDRVKHFNTERLAFVASQMVALESLNALIKEDLPGVGGAIDVVQLTRSGFAGSDKRAN
jgi:hypothetical protein